MSQYGNEMSLKEIFDEMRKIENEFYGVCQEYIEKFKTREQLIDERLNEMEKANGI